MGRGRAASGAVRGRGFAARRSESAALLARAKEQPEGARVRRRASPLSYPRPALIRPPPHPATPNVPPRSLPRLTRHRSHASLPLAGCAADGVVWKAVDRRTKHTVALKKCFDAFRNATDAQRTFREVRTVPPRHRAPPRPAAPRRKLLTPIGVAPSPLPRVLPRPQVMYLQELAGHDSIVRLLNIVRAENDRDIYLVFDYMETDLHAVIRAGIMEDVHKQYVIYQLLKALFFLHSADLIHRDVKPSNLLLNSDCHVKICDFGLCRSVAEASSVSAPVLTDYVATRWYRAPEILLGSTRYTKGVDMWAVG